MIYVAFLTWVFLGHVLWVSILNFEGPRPYSQDALFDDLVFMVFCWAFGVPVALFYRWDEGRVINVNFNIQTDKGDLRGNFRLQEIT